MGRTVAVVYGGRSSEHDVAVRSGASVAAALAELGDTVLCVRIERDGRWVRTHGVEPREVPSVAAEPAEPATVVQTIVDALTGQRVDCVFPALHGRFGEDGTIQGLLELVGTPYVGSGVLGSSLTMDKDRAKRLCSAVGIPVAASRTLNGFFDRPEDAALLRSLLEELGAPVFVKPSRLGSSIGISKAHDEAELRAALELAFRHDDQVLVEAFQAGMEAECGVLGTESPIASPVGRIVTDFDWYDYEAKYSEGGSRVEIPAPIPEATAERIRELAVRAFLACDCAGLARIDFFVLHSGEPVLNEINTIPGFTATSYYAALFGAAGIGYAELVDRLVSDAIANAARRDARVW